jgi:hypothetical protein
MTVQDSPFFVLQYAVVPKRFSVQFQIEYGILLNPSDSKYQLTLYYFYFTDIELPYLFLPSYKISLSYYEKNA